MAADWVYHLTGIVLVLASAAAWVATLFMLPGTWVIVGLVALAAFFLPEAPDRSLGLSWYEVAGIGGLAVLGEVLEFVAGAAGAKKAGASRRAIGLSLVGAVAGSLLGATVGIPIPLVGPIVAALAGGGLGAFVGAWMGETWKGRLPAEKMAVSRMAMIGRVLGTVGKLAVGLVMVLAVGAVFWLV